MNTNPLAALEPIIEPTTVGWFPPALGWWIALGLFVLVALVVIVYFVKRQEHGAHRRQAKKLLKRLYALDDPHHVATSANSILKRTALVTYGHHIVGGLTGEQWLQFLDCKADMRHFHTPLGRLMLECVYSKPNVNSDSLPIRSLLDACVLWVDKHHAINHKMLAKEVRLLPLATSARLHA